jgi:putative YhbY family RNA-binding protein
MLALTPAERRDLRAKAHRLHPVVSIGQHGLTPAVLHEIDVNLLAHELIKVRVFDDDRDARDTLLARICVELDAAPVQHIGKLLVVWRPAPQAAEPEIARPAARREPPKREPRAPARRRRREGSPRASSPHPIDAAKTTPKARRPRTPMPRTPARPPSGATGRAQARAPASGGRRHRRRVP